MRAGGWRRLRSSWRKSFSSGVGMRAMCRSKRSTNGVEQPVEPAAGVRGDREERRALPETAAQHPAHVLDPHRRDVPLREHDQRRVVRLARDVGHGEILVDDALGCVDEDERDVCALRGLECAQLGVVLDSLAVASLAA